MMSAMRRALGEIALTGTWLGGILGLAVLLVPWDALADCTSDSDCRAGRVCRSGTCEYPACAKDVDCAGNQICERGSCVAAGAGEPTSPSAPPPPGPGPAPTAPAPAPSGPTAEPSPAGLPAPPPAALPGPIPPAPTPTAGQPPARFGSGETSTAGSGPAEDRNVAFGPATTERYSTLLFGLGIPVAILGGVGLVVGIPVTLTASDTLDVCLGSDCRSVDVVNTTQRNAGIAVAVVGGAVFVGGLVMTLVGNQKVAVEPATEPAGLRSGERDVYVPELKLGLTSSTARWTF
jgi:hypothetical protein